MSRGAVNFSSDNEYYTPKELVARFGQFDYDPATTPEKAAEFGLKHFDTLESDGLSVDWSPYHRIWINPPFTIKHKFLEKAVQYQEGREIYILAPIEFLTTKRFHTLARGGAYLPAEWQDKVREWSWKAVQKSCFWVSYYQAARYLGDRTIGDLDGTNT